MEPIPEVVWCERLVNGSFEFFDRDQDPVATALPDENPWPREFAVVAPGDRLWFRLVRPTGMDHTHQMVLPGDDLLASLNRDLDGITLILGDGVELDVVARGLGEEVEFFDGENLLAHVTRRRAPGRRHLDPLAQRVGFWDGTPTELRQAILGTLIALGLLRDEDAQFRIRHS